MAKDVQQVIAVRQGFQLRRGAVKCESVLGVPNRATIIFDTAGNDSAGVSNKTIAAHGSGVFLPLGAIITKVTYQVKTTFTSAASTATIAVKAQGANDIVSAIAINDGSAPWTAGYKAGIEDGTVANYLGLTAEREIIFTVAVQALTAGKLVAFVEYTIGL